MPGAQKRRGVLDGDTHPQVRRPRQPVSQSPKPERSLGEYLVGVLRGVGDHVEDFPHESQWHLGVEQVAHRVDEDHARGAPPVRLAERLPMH